jgi:hypothetical protein
MPDGVSLEGKSVLVARGVDVAANQLVHVPYSVWLMQMSLSPIVKLARALGLTLEKTEIVIARGRLIALARIAKVPVFEALAISNPEGD